MAEEYRIEKRPVKVTVLTRAGSTVEGKFYLAAGIYPEGEERISTLLNATEPFVPFDVGREAPKVTMLGRRHIVLAYIPLGEGVRESEMENAVWMRMAVSITLSTGGRVAGDLHVPLHEGKERLSDAVNSGDRFRMIDTANGPAFVNLDHAVEVSRTSD
jgi:hypothetical protein